MFHESLLVQDNHSGQRLPQTFDLRPVLQLEQRAHRVVVLAERDPFAHRLLQRRAAERLQRQERGFALDSLPERAEGIRAKSQFRARFLQRPARRFAPRRGPELAPPADARLLRRL